MTTEVTADSLTRDGDGTQRQSRDCVPGSPRIDKSCIIREHSGFSRASPTEAKKEEELV